MSKYHSRKVTIDGLQFDSKKEAVRFQQLRLLERAGTITELKRQVKFVLLPSQYKQIWDKKTRKWKNRCVEREVSYVADFTYNKDGELVVEDVKGYKGGSAYAMFTVKRKLMLYIHGIQIKEV